MSPTGSCVDGLFGEVMETVEGGKIIWMKGVTGLSLRVVVFPCLCLASVTLAAPFPQALASTKTETARTLNTTNCSSLLNWPSRVFDAFLL